MHSIYKQRAKDKAAEQEKALKKLHFGTTDENQTVNDMLLAGRELREQKAADSAMRFTEWVTSEMREQLARTGDAVVLNPSYISHHHHKFRDRDKSKEIGKNEFGVYYETEKDRIERVAGEHADCRLEREAWFRNQNAPRSPEPCHKLAGSVLRRCEFTDAERVNATVSQSGFDMHAGTPWRQQPVCPQWRPRPKPGELEPKSLDFGISGDQAWDPPPSPSALTEVVAGTLPSSKATGSARTRFDFNSKTDGRTRFNYSVGDTQGPRASSSTPRKKKIYHQSLRGLSAALPRGVTSALAGDGDARRSVHVILGSR